MKKLLTWQEYLEKYDSFQEAYENYYDLYQEIERLNNIINELEIWLEYQADHTMQQHNYYGVLDKLKELKERKYE